MSNQYLYGRSVQVLIGPNGQDGKLIRNLRVIFKIEKTLEKNPNLGTISIYNLNDNSRGIIEQKNSLIQLSAGYGDDIKVIFRGAVAKITTKKQGPDLITEIEAGDGDYAYGNATINQSFAPGATFTQVLSGVTSALGLTAGQQVGTAGTTTFPHGLSLSGMAKDALSSVLGKQGLEWSIQDEQLQILPPGKSTTEDAVLLTTDTGLVGSPYTTKVVDQLLSKPVDGKVAVNGVKLLSLLNANIRCGRYIKVESDNVNGLFVVYKATFNGDTHSQPWYTEVEARSPVT